MIFVHLWWHITNPVGVFYVITSGPIIVVSVIWGGIGWFRHSRCHVDKCHKKAKYPFKHYKLCGNHHPNVPEKITHLHIKQLHKEKYER